MNICLFILTHNTLSFSQPRSNHGNHGRLPYRGLRDTHTHTYTYTHTGEKHSVHCCLINHDRCHTIKILRIAFAVFVEWSINSPYTVMALKSVFWLTAFQATFATVLFMLAIS